MSNNEQVIDPALIKYAETEWQEEVIRTVLRIGSKRGAARELGVAESTIRGIISRLENRLTKQRDKAKAKPQAVPLDGGDVEYEEIATDEQADLFKVDIKSTLKLSEDEILAKAGLDRKRWRLRRHKRWQTTLRGVQVTTHVGNRTVTKTTPIQVWNHHYEFERTAPKPVQDAIEQMMEGWQPPPLPAPVPATGDHLVEVSLYDAHFGKLCWDECTAQKVYTLDEATNDFLLGISTLLTRLSPYPLEKFLFPIGNDFYQIDNWLGTTTKGTPVAHDERITKIFRCGFDAIESSIRIMLKFAPVDLVWVPGNHDLNTSWHLFHALYQRFRGCAGVSFDMDDTRKRKYVDYGNSVIGLQHGDKAKPERMVTVAPTEFPDWSKKRFREIHCGHTHTRVDYKFRSASEHAGTMVRYLPSLSQMDEWHYDNLYVGNKRAAEVVIWSKENGPITQTTAFID